MSGLGIPFALVGGLAVAARAEPRFRRDVDLAGAVANDRDAEQVVHRLAQQGWRAATIVEQAGRGRLATVRLRQAGVGVEALRSHCESLRLGRALPRVLSLRDVGG